MGISNLEARIKKLENTSQSEFGTPANTIFFPVRKLMLSEEKSHNEDGVVFPVLVATWDKPAGVLTPDSIRLIHNDTTVSLPGTATSYRMTGYAVDTTVTVKVTAIYAQGNASTIIAEKTISGDIEPPSVPTYLTVTGGFRTLTLRWENPTAEDFSHVEIWESVSAPNLATAERIAQAYGTEFVRSNCAVLETRWYWIRALDTHGNYSDFTSVASGTTNALQASDIPVNTITDSMLTDTLEQKINDSDAAIQIVDDVRMGEVNVFRQPTAPTEGMTAGDLWVNNSGVVYRYEGGAWVSKAGSTVYDLLKTAIAQYVVKTQVMSGDGKLKVAGFGLYNDSTTGSEFAVLADRFYVYGQKSDGSSYSNIQVFTVDTTTTPPTVGINGNLIVDGSIAGEKIYAGAKIQLGAGGEFIAGAGSVFQLASGVIVLDSETGTIRVADKENPQNGNYLLIDKGDITTYHKFSDLNFASEMKSLRQMESGIAQSGVRRYLTSRFPSKPNIIISPREVNVYIPSAQNETQSIECQINENETQYDKLTGICSFIPRVVLKTSGLSNPTYPTTNPAGVALEEYYSRWTPSTTTRDSVSSFSIIQGIDSIYINLTGYAQIANGQVNGDAAWDASVTIQYYLVTGGVEYYLGEESYSQPPDTYDQNL